MRCELIVDYKEEEPGAPEFCGAEANYILPGFGPLCAEHLIEMLPIGVMSSLIGKAIGQTSKEWN